MEQLVIGIIVGVALLYILNRFRKSLRAPASGGCGKGCGCSSTDNNDTKIVAIPLRNKEKEKR